MTPHSDNNGKFQIPSWFTAANAVQESIVRQEEDKDKALERMVADRTKQAKRRALSDATEYVREIYSRSKTLRRGKCQVWTNDTWHRVMENEMRKNQPLRYLWRTFLQLIGVLDSRVPR